MPYIDKTPVERCKEAIDLWESVMHDPNIDGFNGLKCKQKIQAVRDHANKALANAKEYHEEERFNWYGLADEDEE